MSTAETDPKERLCLALDVSSLAEVGTIVQEVAGMVGIFKVGLELFTSAGPQVVNLIRSSGGRVFADLKFHDIPNTVARAAQAIARLGVSMLNVHASGGSEMMRAAVEAVHEGAVKTGVDPPRVLAVTVLTSLSGAVLRNELGISIPIEDDVVMLAKLAQSSGLDGVVASPREIALIREACGRSFLIVTPGIRPSGSDAYDQKRIATPAEAISLGADYIVVGRPILAARDRVGACERILAEIRSSLLS